MNNGERKLKIKELRDEISNLKSKLFKLEDECSHNIMQKGMSAVCDVCNRNFGWWCPKSPTNLCKYTESMDSCDYCGQPDERK